ncbi:MAG TPA: UDP-N-acetylmuramate:L-alanyl-gamma-D-glutamyl-meso-diaminopimelate ligase [Gammaproteobacteria bacterium]|nr:UDP-N-acetylmuramate:L-alanyl-gamma-D-glutamyl-meso-diaminopimelate ligase [Gammaproteobacteria bacterium]
MHHIHILGICGTFMGGIAQLAHEQGYQVSGSDQNVYPPMSTQLEELGIPLNAGNEIEYLKKTKPDCVVIGNIFSRGNPVVEYILNENIPYQSGPEWLGTHLLKNRWVIGVAGTHGKTTTSSMIAWILKEANYDPGFLIGGVPLNFGVSARMGKEKYFVVEADEYDTAFFDKRAKFVHYKPTTCVINNLEYDHADIFDNLQAIIKQFHHLVRTIPSKGLILFPNLDPNVEKVLGMGCWSATQTFGVGSGCWQAELLNPEGSSFAVSRLGVPLGTIQWGLLGKHNVHNALAAIGACAHVGVRPQTAMAALGSFGSVKRRCEIKGHVNGVTVYDDFAHHPTAIQTTLEAVRAKVGKNRVIAVLDIRSNTFKMGVHQATVAGSLKDADKVFVFQSEEVKWDVLSSLKILGNKAVVETSLDKLLNQLTTVVQPEDHVVIMSNRNFYDLPNRLITALGEKGRDVVRV